MWSAWSTAPTTIGPQTERLDAAHRLVVDNCGTALIKHHGCPTVGSSSVNVLFSFFYSFGWFLG
jgi:hypothetical protein